MKKIYRYIGIPFVFLQLVLMNGCVQPNGQPNNTGTGALAGGIFGAVVGGLAGGHHAGQAALVGGLTGVVVGGLVGHMIDRDQQRRLQEQSPQTWQTIQHNDAVYHQQQQPVQAAAQAPTPGQVAPAPSQAPPADTLIPLTVDDIKALDAAGVKSDAIISEIGKSKSVYKQADITALQQSNPNIDPAIIACMTKIASS